MGQFNQDFHDIFPPLHRPLSLREESQPARGLWLFEQVREFGSIHVRTIVSIRSPGSWQHLWALG